MNLKPLFEEQRELDEKIVKQKGLEGQDLLPKKILALQVELGELANEWRGFKFWSKDQEPRTWFPDPKNVCEVCDGQGYTNPHLSFVERTLCKNCDGCGVHFNNPLLEEYVDCLHFILSIGLELGFEHHDEIESANLEDTTTDMFTLLFETVSEIRFGEKKDSKRFSYLALFMPFIQLGERLGFTWDQIEQAYLDKNATNHERQVTGY
ncbi:dUTP diphosphatase [Alteribacillus sp. YIM 98480]|uniref:dUTP diphosphatase n=1 Tax=Alteribacillus sp. YIM 98480 TaxID=2606599 RepID=UPI00131D5A19|nr:dUTP diphosphatase [Alteribacillus sp. YIM 98480]